MSHLLREDFGAVVRVTLNRPQAMNAFDTAMLEGLEQMVESVRDDSAVRVLVLTGAGKAFCAGADLKAFDAGQAIAPGERDFLDRASDLFQALRSLSKPVIVALNGVTLAGGLELAMCADIILASEHAKIGDGHANFGVFPGGGGASVLPRLIPRNMALYLLYTGRTIGARQLHELGLIAELHPPEVLAEKTLELASQIATRSPVALRRMKEVATAAADKPVRDALLHEQVMLREHLRSADMREGLLAFQEKRVPSFQGR
jgi:enoyl-CoA hydratase/carnithine racemase